MALLSDKLQFVAIIVAGALLRKRQTEVYRTVEPPAPAFCPYLLRDRELNIVCAFRQLSVFAIECFDLPTIGAFLQWRVDAE